MQTIDAMRGQIKLMKKIAGHLAYSSRLAFDAGLTHKSLWKPSKPPYASLLMAMQYLSQALIFNYLEYAPVPKNVWKQLNFIYDLAESSQAHKQVFAIASTGERPLKTSFEHAYKRILMASLVDPHHLPFGAIWEIYEQLDDWVDATELKSMDSVTEANGHFVLDLRSDRKPIPYQKFNLEKVTKTTRLLDASLLADSVGKQLHLLQLGQPLDGRIKLSPFYAKPLLKHMFSVWSLPSTRHTQRRTVQGQLGIYPGIDAVYYVINGRQAFVSPDAGKDEHEIDVSGSDYEEDRATKKEYRCGHWRIVDESSGGFALILNEKPDKSIRVGQLVGLETNDSNNRCTLGLIRWLMISRQVYKIGVEKISSLTQAIAIRAHEGSQADQEYRPAFLIHLDNDPNKPAIVAAKGLYIHLRELDILVAGKEKHISADHLIESGMACEIFTFSEV